MSSGRATALNRVRINAIIRDRGHLRELRPALLLIVARRLKACQGLGGGGHVVYGFIKRWHYEQ
jgi:hypothetical protein